MDKRNEELDILKGLAILCVVLGHTRFWGTHYIYLFHMAVFFMASGFFYKTKSSDTIKNVWRAIYKKIKGLWVPFVIWNAFFTLFNNVFININIYTDQDSLSDYVDESLLSIHSYLSIVEMGKNIVKGFFMASHTELGGAFWFLRVLFYISVAYVIFDYIIKKIIKSEKTILVIQGGISLALLVTGYFMGIKGFHYAAIDVFCSCYCLYYLGVIFSKIKIEKIGIISQCCMFLVGAVLLYVIGKFGSISLGSNSYVNPVYMLTASTLGWIMLWGISGLLKGVTPIKNGLMVIGQNSIYIVIFHFLAFKVVSLIYAIVNSYPLVVVAGFPVATTAGVWWIAYTVVGTGIPVAIGMWFNYLKKKIVGFKTKAVEKV